MKVKLRCFLFGHKKDKRVENGAHYCDRCDAHEFYDYYYQEMNGDFNKWDFTLQNFRNWASFFIVISWQWVRNRLYERCYDCRKTKRMLWWRSKHNHDDCMPF